MPSRKRHIESAPEQNATLEDTVADLTGEVRTLSQHVEVLRIAVDDLRQEVEWALRQRRRNDWVPTQPLTSVTKDPCANDFTVNRVVSAAHPSSQPATEGTSEHASSASTQRDLWD